MARIPSEAISENNTGRRLLSSRRMPNKSAKWRMIRREWHHGRRPSECRLSGCLAPIDADKRYIFDVAIRHGITISRLRQGYWWTGQAQTRSLHPCNDNSLDLFGGDWRAEAIKLVLPSQAIEEEALIRRRLKVEILGRPVDRHHLVKRHGRYFACNEAADLFVVGKALLLIQR